MSPVTYSPSAAQSSGSMMPERPMWSLRTSFTATPYITHTTLPCCFHRMGENLRRVAAGLAPSALPLPHADLLPRAGRHVLDVRRPDPRHGGLRPRLPAQAARAVSGGGDRAAGD